MRGTLHTDGLVHVGAVFGELLGKHGFFENLEGELILAAEEALYMCQIKKVLTVEDKNGKSLSLKGLKLELEKYFDPKVLALRFAALCYYKEIGWVVKDGVKFGADFVLYKGSPELFHSSYAVVLKDETTARTLSWESLMNLHRLCSQVIKDCVLCVVNEGRAQKLYAGNSNHHASVPVRHLAMKRWLPQRERDAK